MKPKDVVLLKIKLSFQLLSAIANDVRVNKYNIIVCLKFINNYFIFFIIKNIIGRHTKYIKIPYTPDGKLNIDKPVS
tara:strand:+ start:2326 stop:2556 length:231 start_codon:yes stop_codon:yes gene_type:complete